MKRAILLPALAILFACNPSVHEEGHSHHTHHTAIDEELPEILLQEGLLWEVPAHMHDIIKKMQQTAFLEDISLAEKAGLLDNQIDELTSNCSLQGDAHNELHKLLHALIEAVEQMEKSETKLAQKADAKARNVLALYDTFFTSETEE
jgi:hypothetical protein